MCVLELGVIALKKVEAENLQVHFVLEPSFQNFVLIRSSAFDLVFWCFYNETEKQIYNCRES